VSNPSSPVSQPSTSSKHSFVASQVTPCDSCSAFGWSLFQSTMLMTWAPVSFHLSFPATLASSFHFPVFASFTCDHIQGAPQPILPLGYPLLSKTVIFSGFRASGYTFCIFASCCLRIRYAVRHPVGPPPTTTTCFDFGPRSSSSISTRRRRCVYLPVLVPPPPPQPQAHDDVVSHRTWCRSRNSMPEGSRPASRRDARILVNIAGF